MSLKSKHDKGGVWDVPKISIESRPRFALPEVSAPSGSRPLRSRKEATLADPFITACVSAVRLNLVTLVG